MTPTRPIVRYHGGKWVLAPWIISHMPAHRRYVEPFGGGGSVLLRKPRTYMETYNDLSGEMVNLFRVARDRGAVLREALRLTPFARDEYAESFTPDDDPVEQARRTVIRSFMGFASNSLARGTRSGFRAVSDRSGTTPAHEWANYPGAFDSLIERLRGVVIENRLAIDVMRAADSAETLHYCDPPYVHATRSMARCGRHAYDHEMSDDQHSELAAFLRGLSGAVMVSGYRCPLYDALYAGWQRVDRTTHADGARARVESLWFSPSCGVVGLFGAEEASA